MGNPFAWSPGSMGFFNDRFPGGCQPSDVRVPGLLDLIKLARPHTVLEIGCYDGVSTEVFALNCKYVIAMDPWHDVGDNIREAFFRRMRSYTNIYVIQAPSPEGFKFLPTAEQLFCGQIDMVYIDGDHSEEAVTRDIEASIAFLGSRARIAGHDYDGPDTPGVKRAVDRLLGPVVTFQDTSWFCPTFIGDLKDR